jgi:hypothetical protein
VLIRGRTRVAIDLLSKLSRLFFVTASRRHAIVVPEIAVADLANPLTGHPKPQWCTHGYSASRRVAYQWLVQRQSFGRDGR